MRVLIAGTGSIALRHFNNLKKLYPEVKIVILTRSKEGFQDKKEFHSADTVIHDKKDIVNFTFHAAFICNPATMHVNLATYLISHSINTFIEKPISHSLEGTEKLIELAKKNKVILMVGYVLRFNKALLFFRNAIKNNTIGRIIRVSSECSSYLPDWRPGFNYKESVSAKSSLGGGVLLEVSHEIDYLRWIFGELTLLSSYTSKLSDLSIDTEDYAFLLMKKNNIIIELSINFFSKQFSRLCRAIGEKGSLEWNYVTNEVIFMDNNKYESKIIYSNEAKDGNDMYIDELIYFFRCINNDIDIKPDASDALNTLKLILECKLKNKVGA